MRRLTPTSFALLGLLAIRPWTTYELTKQMRRAMAWFWPRAESNIYAEPRHLLAAGLAEGHERLVGRRSGTAYTITPDGREALRAWLELPAGPTQLECEALLKVLFADSGTLAQLRGHVQGIGQEARDEQGVWRAIGQEYLDGTAPFQDRGPINVLIMDYLSSFARMRQDWAERTLAELEAWPDTAGPTDGVTMRARLRSLPAPGGPGTSRD